MYFPVEFIDKDSETKPIMFPINFLETLSYFLID